MKMNLNKIKILILANVIEQKDKELDELVKY